MSVCYFDKIYRKLLLSKFFVKGWGNPDHLEKIFNLRKIMADKKMCYNMVDPKHPVQVTKESALKDCRIIEGQFTSPFETILPGLMPRESVQAQFQMLVPSQWSSHNYRPVCIQYAGTGDHYYARRRILMARPLLKEYGIASIILENPFYGSRKPPQQKRSALCNVSDLFVMGACLILESQVLMHWCADQGLGPVGFSGISMGGHMASLAACSWPKPVPLIPCLSSTTASAVFTQGVLSEAIDWELLKCQYLQDETYRERIFNRVTSPEGYFSVYREVAEIFAKSRSSSVASESSLKAPAEGGSIKHHFSNIEQHNNVISSLTGAKKNLKDFTTPSSDLLFRNNIVSQSEQNANNFNESNADNRSKTKKLFSKVENLVNINTYRNTKPIEGSKKLYRLKRPPPIDPKVDPHLGFTPIGVIPQNTTHDKPVMFSPFTRVKDPVMWEVFQFMRGIMDECTHLGNYGTPTDTELIIIIQATKDAYMPVDSITPLDKLWPGCQVRALNTGHVRAFLMCQQMFRKAINDAFIRTYDKYGPRIV